MESKLKLSEALVLLSRADKNASVYEVSLAIGSMADPLSHLLAAYIQRRVPDHRISISTGAFDDFVGNLKLALSKDAIPAAAVIEWADLDPRLGLRQAGTWGRNIADDILQTANSRLRRILALFEDYPNGCAVAFVPPTLLPAPVSPVPSWQRNALELGLDALLAPFLARIAALNRVRIVAVPFEAERLDVKGCLQAGFPYRLPFASGLAQAIAAALFPAQVLKGVITDLDDTLWSGILGEVGPANVYWDLDHKAAHHGMYQRFLWALAQDGTLVAIASKNDQKLVEQVLRRPDLLLRPDSIFPVEAHWRPKVESVGRILKRWNIGPEAVVFIDDNALELELVRSAFPTMQCRLFPSEDPDTVLRLLKELSDLLGKSAVLPEDALRLSSIRMAETFGASFDGSSTQEDVLKACKGELTISLVGMPPDPRALELINKTNQFNLNGIRYTDADWLAYLRGQDAAAWIVTYSDKFGLLGKIAVLAARRKDASLIVDTWVTSCRAFSRRIEHAVMDHLFYAWLVEEKVHDGVLDAS